MTDRPAFSDDPQGSKTGAGFVHDPASEAFIAECADEGWQPAVVDGKPTEAFRSAVQEHVDAELAQEQTPKPKPQRRTQTVNPRVTLDTFGDPRAVVELVLRQGLGPRVKVEWPDGERAKTGSFGDGVR
jgi:hypothetical protein